MKTIAINRMIKPISAKIPSLTVKMPQEGQTTVTIAVYFWEKAKRYFKEHEKELRKKGIKSLTRLITVWIEEKCAEE